MVYSLFSLVLYNAQCGRNHGYNLTNYKRNKCWFGQQFIVLQEFTIFSENAIYLITIRGISNSKKISMNNWIHHSNYH
jgi:hypothetical protein